MSGNDAERIHRLAILLRHNAYDAKRVGELADLVAEIAADALLLLEAAWSYRLSPR